MAIPAAIEPSEVLYLLIISAEGPLKTTLLPSLSAVQHLDSATSDSSDLRPAEYKKLVRKFDL